MIRYAAVSFFLLQAGTLFAQHLSLPFASPPYGANGNVAVAWDATATVNALKDGAFGLSGSIEYCPHQTSKYSLKGTVSYFHIGGQSLFSQSALASPTSSFNASIYEFMFTMRAYPTGQALNTFFVGLGMGADIIASSISDPLITVTSSTVIQPEIQFETGYKARVFRNFFVEPSLNYKLVLPPPGVSFSANVPLFTFFEGGNSSPLNGINLALSAGFEFR